MNKPPSYEPPDKSLFDYKPEEDLIYIKKMKNEEGLSPAPPKLEEDPELAEIRERMDKKRRIKPD